MTPQPGWALPSVDLDTVSTRKQMIYNANHCCDKYKTLSTNSSVRNWPKQARHQTFITA